MPKLVMWLALGLPANMDDEIEFDYDAELEEGDEVYLQAAGGMCKCIVVAITEYELAMYQREGAVLH